MAIDFNGALTLADQAILSNDPLVKEITKSLHQTWNAVKDIPFYTSPSLRQIGMRYTNSGIPTPNWTGINSEPQAVKGKPKQYEEQMFLLRNKITIDKVLLDQPNNIIDPVDAQVQMFLEGFAYDFNDKFINNDPTSSAPGNSPDCFPGLKYRLNNPTQFDMASDMTLNSAADMSLAVLLASGGSAQANRFIYDVQTLFDNMNAPDGDGIVLYVSEVGKRIIEAAIRVMGIGSGFDVTQDNYDRPVEMYKNAKIRVVGRKADGLTSVIPMMLTFQLQPLTLLVLPQLLRIQLPCMQFVMELDMFRVGSLSHLSQRTLGVHRKTASCTTFFLNGVVVSGSHIPVQLDA